MLMVAGRKCLTIPCVRTSDGAVSLWSPILPHIVAPDVIAGAGEVVRDPGCIQVDTGKCDPRLSACICQHDAIWPDNAAVPDHHPWSPGLPGLTAKAGRHVIHAVIDSLTAHHYIHQNVTPTAHRVGPE